MRYEQDSRAAHDIRVTTKIYPLMVESSQGGVIGGGPLRVLSCKEGLGEGKQNAHVTNNRPSRHPGGGPDELGRKKGGSEDERQGKAWEGHALKSHRSAPEHKAKAQGESRPTGGGQQSPSGLSAKTSKLGGPLVTPHGAMGSVSQKKTTPKLKRILDEENEVRQKDKFRCSIKARPGFADMNRSGE